MNQAEVLSRSWTARTGSETTIFISSVWCGDVLSDDPSYCFHIVRRYARMDAAPSVELDARFLLRTVAIKVVPMHEVARPPQPPFSSYWPQRKCLKGANSAKWDALGSPQVVPADRDPVVVTDDSPVVIKGLLALIVESSSIRPPLRGLQVPNRT